MNDNAPHLGPASNGAIQGLTHNFVHRPVLKAAAGEIRKGESLFDPMFDL